MSALDTIRAATGVSRTVTLILDGALQAEWDTALAAMDDAAENDTGSLAMPALTAAVDHLDSLRDRVRASEVQFQFTSDGLEWTEYLQMQAAHPPRDDNPLDRIRGFNVETFYPALIRATCLTVASAASEPEPMPADAWDRLLGKDATDEEPATKGTLNVKQVNTLADAAFYVMNGESKVPPSARSLLTSQDSGTSLAQPSPGTPPPSDSEAGSRPTSPRSSTKKKARTKAGSDAT